MEDINYSVDLHLDNVRLNITVDDKLKRTDGNLRNFGYIEVSTGCLEDKPCWWDNISFFIDCGRKKFKKECSEELKEKGFNTKETYNTIKRLLKRAIKLKLLHKNEK